MKLDALRILEKDIRKNKLTFDVFEFKIAKAVFHVYFDVGTAPYQLVFVQLKSNFELYVEVKLGYIISSYIPKDKYKHLCNILGLTYDKNNPFSPQIFFEEFHSKIPNSISHINNEIKKNVIIKTYPNIEKADKLYYYGIKDWSSPINKGEGNRSPENLEKTRRLYPYIYEVIKDKNISILYTAKKEDENTFLL